MISNPETPWSPGPTGARRDHRLRDGVDALGFPLVPLTLRTSRRIVKVRKADNSIRDERAGPPRLALICAARPDVSPVANGGNAMSRVRGTFVSSVNSGVRRARIGGGLLALALSASLWLGTSARAQDSQI